MEKRSLIIRKSSELMWLIGLILVPLGVSLCKKADLGVSMIAAPAFILSEFLSGFWSGFTAGMLEYVVQGLLLIILMIVVRRTAFRYILTFLTAVCYGLVLDLWLMIFGTQPYSSVYLRWIMFFVGDAIIAFGVSCFFKTYLPQEAYELFVTELSSRYGFRINKVKLFLDISFLILSIAMALLMFGDAADLLQTDILSSGYHSIGIGTVITTIINYPLILLSGKLLDRFFEFSPRFPKLYGLLHQDR